LVNAEKIEEEERERKRERVKGLLGAHGGLKGALESL
jgi:hypothetical protein